MIREKTIIEQCSPTLLGIKTGSIFTVKFTDFTSLNYDLEIWNRKFQEKSLKLMILRAASNVALIYIYREDALRKDLSDDTARKIMQTYGYTSSQVCHILEMLKTRFVDYNEFPHEIGLFLGYPPADVEGFICNKGKNCKLCGYWKVYGNTTDAMIKFATYDQCRDLYLKLWKEGNDIMRLTVA